MRVDYIAQSPDGRTLLAIEARARYQFERSDAEHVLSIYQEDKLLDRITYFCVIAPKVGYLWRLRDAKPEQSWEFPTVELLRPYVPADMKVPPLEFEYVVGHMMRDVLGRSAVTEIPAELQSSGVLDALRGARMTSAWAA